MKRQLNILIILTLLGLTACGSKKETGVPIYLDVEEMDPQIEKCFSDKLYDKWASLQDLTPHDKSQTYSGKPEEKHIFKSYDKFDVDKDPPETEKFTVSVYGDGDTTNTFFSVRGWRWQKEGIWQQVINLGNFRIPDRKNDQINPGKVDEEEICDHLVYVCIRASFK